MAVQLRNNDGYTWHVQTKRNNIQKQHRNPWFQLWSYMIYHIRLCFLRIFYNLQYFFPALLAPIFCRRPVCPRCHITSCQLHAGGFQRFLLFLHRKARCNDHDRQIEPARGAGSKLPRPSKLQRFIEIQWAKQKATTNPGSWNSQWVKKLHPQMTQIQTYGGVVLVLHATRSAALQYDTGRRAMEIYQNPPFSRTKKVWIFPARHLSVTTGTTFGVAFLRCRSTAWSTSPRHPSACCQAAWHLGSPLRPKSPEQWKNLVVWVYGRFYYPVI